jgi:hypothetical protein
MWVQNKYICLLRWSVFPVWLLTNTAQYRLRSLIAIKYLLLYCKANNAHYFHRVVILLFKYQAIIFILQLKSYIPKSQNFDKYSTGTFKYTETKFSPKKHKFKIIQNISSSHSFIWQWNLDN